MASSYRFVLALLCLLWGCTAAPAPRPAPNRPPAPAPMLVLRLVSPVIPPFADHVGQPRMALELVQAALDRAGFKATTQILEPATSVEALQMGGADGSPDLWRSADRDKFLLFSDAYLENRLILVGREGTDVSAKSFAELAGKKIGIVAGYAYGPELDHAKEPVFVEGKGAEENLRALLRGELDYVLEDALVIHHLARQHPDKAQQHLEFGQQPLFTRTMHLALRRDLPEAKQIIERFNRELVEMRKDGSYNVALQVDWIRADVNGDGRDELISTSDQVGAEIPKAAYDLSAAPGRNGVQTDHGEPAGGFVIQGVYYDTWDQVPEDMKHKPAQSPDLNPKPGTLRLNLFKF